MARLVEIFSSIQGEAELVGVRQIFVRFFGCNMRCEWCDSPETLTAPRGPLLPARLEERPGSGRFTRLDNPVDVAGVLGGVRRLNDVPHHSVSLTGGEPLLHVGFLERLIPAIQGEALRIYLETNGLLPDHLSRVVDRLDWVAMDLKPPSCTGQPWPNWLELHRRFITIARDSERRPRLFFKLIVSADADRDELRTAFDLVAETAPDCSLTLQPVTPFGRVRSGPSMEAMLGWHELAAGRLKDVRIVPQLHKLMNVL